VSAPTNVRPYGPDEVRPGDWIKYRSSYYGGGRLAEVHALGADERCGAYAVTAEGNVLLERVIEIRRRPIEVFAVARLSR
jgi:hypothetical protein